MSDEFEDAADAVPASPGALQRGAAAAAPRG